MGLELEVVRKLVIWSRRWGRCQNELKTEP